MYLMPTVMWLAWEEKVKIKSVGVYNDLENDHSDFQIYGNPHYQRKITLLKSAIIFLISKYMSGLMW